MIENNKRRIEILEEMAETIYREWFVNFNFPGSEDVEMKDSDLGLIPENFNVVSFDEISEILSGGTPKTSVAEYWGGDIPFFTPKDYRGEFYLTETSKSLTQKGVENCSSEFYSKNTVFITARGTVGEVVLPGRKMAMNQSCYALKGRGEIHQYYIFLAIRNLVQDLQKQAHGATFDTIIMDTFKNIYLAQPPDSLIDLFVVKIAPIFKLILNLHKRNKVLVKTRDLLLPKFISGDIKPA